MLEAEDIFLRKACFEDWEAMYRNVWSRPEAARFMVWQVTKGEEVLCGKEFFIIRGRIMRLQRLWHYPADLFTGDQNGRGTRKPGRSMSWRFIVKGLHSSLKRYRILLDTEDEIDGGTR